MPPEDDKKDPATTEATTEPPAPGDGTTGAATTEPPAPAGDGTEPPANEAVTEPPATTGPSTEELQAQVVTLTTARDSAISERDAAIIERDSLSKELHGFKVEKAVATALALDNMGMRDPKVVVALIKPDAITFTKNTYGADSVSGIFEEVNRLRSEFPSLFFDSPGSANGGDNTPGSTVSAGDAFFQSLRGY